MTDEPTPELPLAEAQEIVQRAIDKAENLGLSGAIAVVDASGALITASRMDQGGAGGMARARSKAWISATQQIPSSEHLHRMTVLPAPISHGFLQCSPEARFPGSGGMPIRRGGVVVAGIAASGATVSPFIPEGAEPEQMIADGLPANPEDIVVHYALGLRYVGQHGDDRARWVARFGDWPEQPGDGLGMQTAATASHQTELRRAAQLARAAMDVAAARGLRVAVAVVDRRGEPMQQDAMTGAPTAASFTAAATAATAASFGCTSGEVSSWYGNGETLAQLSDCLPFDILAAPGGMPVERDGRIVGGLGIGGVSPDIAAEIARLTLEQHP